jgi:rhodanese-related sulfurtransferase
MTPVAPALLKEWLHDGAEIALLDVREAGEFGEGHLFYAVPAPLSRFEPMLEVLVPCRAARLVLCDDGASGVAARAAAAAEALGHSAVSVLEGGTAAWKDAGFRLFRGVNVPSKTFGELVEHERGVRSIEARDLARRLDAGENLVILDGRTVAEHHRMTIPGSIACPNGELVYRLGGLAPDPRATIVVNCAGRTRSIIGAATLRGFGVANEVVALRNGTMGWNLAGLRLEHGSARRYGAAPQGESLAALRRRALDFAGRNGIPRVPAATLRAWLGDTARTTYLLDVRTQEEFLERHLAAARHAEGGQLVQATDQWLAVRGARVVLVDDTEIRAVIVADWLRQMGWDAAVLEGGETAWPALADVPPPESRTETALPALVPLDAASPLARDAALLDARPAMAFRAGHIAGARWATRARLDRVLAALGGAASCVIIADDETVARLLARDLVARGVAVTGLLRGTLSEWRAAGLPVEATPDDPPDREAIDHLFFVAARHEGDLEAARRYLEWEVALVDQIDPRERAGFRIRPV